MKRFTIGWTKEEDALLLEAADEVRKALMPLSVAFDQVAAATGRKPNSVRNRYYTVRKTAAAASPAFVPFSEEESMRLLKTVLLAQTAGESVRACTLRIADGDTKQMLRYQNKYRAILKTRPDCVREALRQLDEAGTPARDPYLRQAPVAAARPTAAGGVETTIRMLLTALYDTMLELAKRNSTSA